MKAYKFTKRQYYDRGTFRLGTLYDYRREETYGAAIGDAREGSFDRQHTFEFKTTDKLIQNLALNQEFGWMYLKGEKTDRREKDRFILNFTSTNLLIFSATLTDDDSLFNEFNGVDCCVEICDFEEFCRALVGKIPRVEKCRVKECVYTDRTIANNRDPMPSLPFIKDRKYSKQCEVRLAIQLWGDPTEPLTVSSLDVLRYCRLIKP